MTSLYLNLGSGKVKHPDFVRVDLDPCADVPMDLTAGLPWQDRTVNGIYSGAFIEHISQAQGVQLLRECHRVMIPGGILRIATPDLDMIAQDYVTNHEQPSWTRLGMNWVANRCERMNIAMREWGNQWLYNEEELVRLATMVGFEVKGRMTAGQSDLPQFQNLETPDTSCLIVEFIKPERMVKNQEMPLVTIAIPAYNPRYFPEAFGSALAQTYSNLEIIVCDDCRTDEIETIVKRLAHGRHQVRYLHNPERLKGYKNLLRCFAEAKGEFIKFLNDDDILAPHCVERMIDCFRQVPDLTLVTSHRQIINAQGQICLPVPATVPVTHTDCVIEGLSLGDALVSGEINFVGEPSTALFRKKELAHVSPDFMCLDKHPMRGVNDIATWVHLALRGNAVYIAESLSKFRIHAEQNQVVMGSELAPITQEARTKMRHFWARFGFARHQSQMTLRCKSVTAQEQPWHLLAFAPNHAAWAPCEAVGGMPLRSPPCSPSSCNSSPQNGPDDPLQSDQARYAHAEQLFDAGKENEAVNILVSLANNNTSHWQVYNDLGVYAFQNGDTVLAEQVLKIALSKEPVPTAAYLNLANILVADGRSGEGKELVHLYLRQFPEDENAWLLLKRLECPRPAS